MVFVSVEDYIGYLDDEIAPVEVACYFATDLYFTWLYPGFNRVKVLDENVYHRIDVFVACECVIFAYYADL